MPTTETTLHSPHPQIEEIILAGGGKMGTMMRAFDWTSSPLGPVSGWPQSLRTAVSIALNSQFPTVIFWGPDLVMLYNDAYLPILADKHPAALGQAARECWPEIWAIIGPMLQGVLNTGQATWSSDLLLPIVHNGTAAAHFFTFSYSPIRDEAGKVCGVFCPVIETTERFLGERREQILRQKAGAARIKVTESEKRFRAIIDHSWDVIALLTDDGTILYTSPSITRVLGYGAAELVGRNTFTLFHPEDLASTRLRHAQLIHEPDVSVTVQFRYRHKDGSWRWVESIGTNLLAEPSVHAIVANFRDITERKQTEEALRRSEQELTDFFENATVGLHWVSADGIILRVNRAELDLLGYTREEYIGRHIAEFHLDQAVIQEILNRLTQGETLHDCPARLRCKDGSVRHVLIDSNVLWKDGQFVHTRCVTRDITVRKQAEDALIASEERWRTLAEALPALVWMARPDGFLDYYNQRWYDYTGLTAEQLAGWGWEAVWHPEDLPEGRARWLESLRTGQPYEYQARFRRATDGSFRWQLIRAVPLRDQEGRVLRWFGTNTDIEEQKYTAAELQRVNDELQQFAHIVSHDLNEPLRTMSSFAALLAREYEGKLDATADEYIAFVTDGAQRMQGMITDLLAYTQAGGQEIMFVPVDGEDLLARVLMNLQLAIADAKAEVTHDPLPMVQGDVTRLSQVLQNLISNALKFRSKEPPRIHVSAQRDGSHWQFSVRDNGIGLDPRQADRIFQVFRRLHIRSEYPGTGMGLTICKKIVERHGGRIWVESKPGEGSIFYFTIQDRL